MYEQQESQPNNSTKYNLSDGNDNDESTLSMMGHHGFLVPAINTWLWLKLLAIIQLNT